MIKKFSGTSQLEVILMLKTARDLYQLESKNIENISWFDKLKKYYFLLDKKNFDENYSQNNEENFLHTLELIQKLDSAKFFQLYVNTPNCIYNIENVLELIQKREYSLFLKVLNEAKNFATFSRLIELSIQADSFYLFLYAMNNFSINSGIKNILLENIASENLITENLSEMIGYLINNGANPNTLSASSCFNIVNSGNERIINLLGCKNLSDVFKYVLSEHLELCNRREYGI
jgi:hypothetical protein